MAPFVLAPAEGVGVLWATCQVQVIYLIVCFCVFIIVIFCVFVIVVFCDFV